MLEQINNKINLYPKSLPINSSFKAKHFVTPAFNTDYKNERNLLNFTGGVYPTFNPNAIKHDYKNIADASRCLIEKIEKRLDVKSPEDIEKIINIVMTETGANRATVQEVVGRISQFSSFSQLDAFNKALGENNVSNIALLEDYCTINSALSYLQAKHQVSIFPSDDARKSLFLDNNTLFALKNGAIDDFDSEDYKLFLLDGSYVKYHGKVYSRTFLGQNCSIEEMAIAVISKMKEENLTIDQALNCDIVNEVKKVLPNNPEIEIKVLKNDNLTKYTSDTISDALRPNMPSSSELLKMLDEWFEYFNFGLGENKKEIKNKLQSTFLNFYDNMGVFHSANTISNDLRKMHNKILQKIKCLRKNEEDIVYLIPTRDKSFDFIANAYINANDISPNSVKYFYKNHYNPNSDFSHDRSWLSVDKELNGKIVVILDDVVGSGDSMAGQELDYGWLAEDFGVSNIIFAPLVCQRQGYNHILDTVHQFGRIGKDFVLPVIEKNYYMDFRNNIDTDTARAFTKYVDREGYNSCLGCDILPYMIPDYNCGPASMLNAFFVYYPRQILNKLPGDMYNSIYHRIKKNNENSSH